MTALHLRAGGPDDAALCHDLYFHAVRSGAAPQYSPAQRAAWVPDAQPEPWMAERLARNTTWIATLEDTALGFLSADLPQPGVAYLDLFFVRPDQRRGAVAPALYDAFAAWAGSMEAPTQTAHASHLLKPFLLRRGWTALAEETTSRHGIDLNRWVMERRAP